MSTEHDRLMYATYDRLHQLTKKMESLPAAKTSWFLQELAEVQYMLLGILDNATRATHDAPVDGEEHEEQATAEA